jgi:hypothetical protein
MTEKTTEMIRAETSVTKAVPDTSCVAKYLHQPPLYFPVPKCTSKEAKYHDSYFYVR